MSIVKFWRLTTILSASLLVFFFVAQANSQSLINNHCGSFDSATQEIEFADEWIPEGVDTDAPNWIHIEDLGAPASGDWTENIIAAQNLLPEGPGFIYFPRNNEYFCKSPFVPRSNTTYYGGGILKMEFLSEKVDEFDENFIQFGLGGSNGGGLENITFGGLAFDFNGFRSNSNIIEWNNKRNISNILLTNLTFFDSKCGTAASQNIQNITDSFAINIGGWATMQNFTVQDCVHNSPVHQFLASGFKAQEVAGMQYVASINDLKIVRNKLHGSRSVAISVKARKGNPPDPHLLVSIRNVLIDGNTIINPWNNVISIGLDGETSNPRGVKIDGMEITNNVFRWDDFEYFDNLDNTPAIRCYSGEVAGSRFDNVLIKGNTVIDNHPREVTGVSITSGQDFLNNPAPRNVKIVDNFFPKVRLSKVRHSGIRVARNTLNPNDTTPSELEIGAYKFDSLNDLPFLANPIDIDLDTLDVSFRLYVPELPENGEHFYLVYFDDSNFIRLHHDGRLRMEIGGEGRFITGGDGNSLQPNTTYDVSIEGLGNNRFHTVYNGVATNVDIPTNQTTWPVSCIGARINPAGNGLNPTQLLNGFIWSISLSDGHSTNTYLPGLLQDPAMLPWPDSVMTPTMPFVFDGESEIPVPTFPIHKSLDGVDIQFRMYCEDFSEAAYLFYRDQQNFLRINEVVDNDGGALVWKINGQQRTLIPKNTLREDQSYSISIRGSGDTGSGVNIATSLNGVVESFRSFDQPKLVVDSIGGRVNGPGNFQGAIWDLEIRDNSPCDTSINDTPSDCFEKYNGAVRLEADNWEDLLGSNFRTFNHAFLTPIHSFDFAGSQIVRFDCGKKTSQTPLRISYNTPFEISFSMRIDDLSEPKVLFFQNGTNFIRLRPDGKIHIRTDGVSANIFNSNRDKIVRNGTYHVRIIGNGETIKAVVNNSEGNAIDPDMEDESVKGFTINAIGGNSISGASLFDGLIWDLAISIDSIPVAQYHGDYNDELIGPWEDLIGDHDGTVNCDVTK